VLGNFPITYLCLQMEAGAAEEIDFLVAGISGQTDENGQMVLLLNEEVLGGAKADICDAETVGIVEGRGVGNGSESGRPVECEKVEWCREFEVAAIGTFSVVGTVVSCEVGKPLRAKEAEVVTDIRLPDMSGLVGFVLKVVTLREPIVGHADIEAFLGVGEYEIQLFCVVFVEPNTSPSGEAQALPFNAKSRLQAEIGHILTAPNVLIYEVDAHNKTCALL